MWFNLKVGVIEPVLKPAITELFVDCAFLRIGQKGEG